MTTYPDDSINTINEGQMCGLTKREYFAAMAMQGIAAQGGGLAEHTAGLAVLYADELIKELNKQP